MAACCCADPLGFGTSLLKATFPDVRIDYSVEGLTCEIGLVLGRAVPQKSDPDGLSAIGSIRAGSEGAEGPFMTQSGHTAGLILSPRQRGRGVRVAP
jgi:hypothetical protein